ncbi:MAG: ArsR/SmtB family transcription factor [Tepidiformaceae bacterium]
MPVELQPARRAALGLRIAPSAVIELYEATAVLGYLGNWGELKAAWVEGVANRDALVASLQEWLVRPPLSECWGNEEILFYAHRSGTLFDTSPDRFFERFDAVAAMPPGDTQMPTETPEVIEAVTERMERYHRDPDARHAYCEALKQVWEAIRPEWERDGLRRVEEACEGLRADFERSHDLKDVIPPTHLSLRDQFYPLVEGGYARGELVITPCYFAGEAGHIVEIAAGLVHIGFGFDFARKLERIREGAERAAMSFKLVSDPTRATILKLIGQAPHSITDLANVLGLAQPTVSIHVKQLREAGLVTSTRAGASTLYQADAAKLRALLDEASRALLPRT